tara:strand:- start:292 stop:1419 length:1128 start_codon:yes stop_codon:yes gene_type:complete
MATIFKTFLSNDVVSTRTLLHEAIPITGTIVSGTYGDYGSEGNIKDYSHGMFQSVYDYPYLSSSANHIFDITVGYSSKSSLSGTTIQNAKKINIYNQMAQVLMGYDQTGSIQEFDEDGNILAGGTKLRECYFLNFSRLLTKDEIKKGSFALELGVSGTWDSGSSQTEMASRIRLTDANGANDYRVNSPAGEYAVLYADSTVGTNLTTDDGSQKAGLLFYQAGIAVVTASVFTRTTTGGILANAVSTVGENAGMLRSGSTGGMKMNQVLTGSSISSSCDALRHRIYSLSFNNTTELNSTVYFCRANHNDFNYSSNPTYLSGSKIRVKQSSTDTPVAYATTVGLYSADNELMACAKLSEPLKKDPTTEFTLRVRLDY